MKKTSILTLGALLSYFLGAFNFKTEVNQNSKYIAIAVRMVFTQQCTESMDQYFGKSSNSMMMSKEHIQMSNICYKIADQISQEIEKTKEINEDNIVDVVDRAMGKVKKDLASFARGEDSVVDEDQKSTVEGDLI